MSNVIKIKGKLSGAPLLSDLLVREICFDMQTGHMYFKKDAATLVGPFMANGGLGDMLKSIYDSNNNGKVDLAEDSEKLGGIIATNYATTTYVTSAIDSLVNSAPGTLNTLNELATALGNDANFASTITTALANKLDSNSIIDGGTF